MAVYTEVSDDDLNRFVARYALGRVVSCKGIAEGVENSNYLLATEQGQFILTLYEKRVDRADLPFFLGLMHHLAAAGVPCPLPVADRDGSALNALCDRPAVIVTFLSGQWPRRIRPVHCAALGEALGRLHLAGEGFPLARTNTLSVAGWRPLIEACGARADTVAPGLAEALAREWEVLARNWPAGLPSGIIHADLFPDNVFFQDDRLTGLIDFYFACTDAFAYDLAICLNAWCFDAAGGFEADRARLLLDGYRRLRPLGPAEVEALPMLARGSALRFLLTRLYDWLNHPVGAFVKPKDPLEYFGKLRFHQQFGSPAVYGAMSDGR